jgi:tRNA(Arg) A34 adenosine deaminase TadA
MLESELYPRVARAFPIGGVVYLPNPQRVASIENRTNQTTDPIGHQIDDAIAC